MLDQLLEISRKAVESSLQMQQVMFKQWTQLWPSTSPTASGLSADWGGSVQKRWAEAAVEALNKHREAMNASYAAGIQIIEQTFHLAEVRSWDDVIRTMEELWRNLFESFRGQAEAQFHDFETWTKKVYEASSTPTPTSPTARA